MKYKVVVPVVVCTAVITVALFVALREREEDEEEVSSHYESEAVYGDPLRSSKNGRKPTSGTGSRRSKREEMFM